MAVTRPLKEGSVTTYQAKVAAGFPDILASEMDADLDTIYAAWNAGVGTGDLGNGSVTYAKLAPDAQLWKDTGTTLIPGTSFATRVVAVPGDTNGGTVLLGNATAKGRVQGLTTTPGTLGLTANRNWAASNAQDDATKPSWALLLRADTDQLALQRSPAGSTTQTNLFLIDALGNLTGLGAAVVLTKNNATGGQATLSPYSNTGLYLAVNDRFSPPAPAAASWSLEMDTAGAATFMHRAAGAGSNTSDQSFTLGAAGNLTITGSIGQKSSGTTWANPSDRRLKNEIEDYATGLAAILQLQPRTFVYNGQGGSTVGMRGYGFIADEVETAMPEMVGNYHFTREGAEDTETDYATVDQSNLILALVNAVKELAARIEAPR